MKKTEKALVVRQEEPSIALLLQGVIQQGVTADNVSALEKMCDLYERMEAKRAEKEFAAALVGLQGETLRVAATQVVNDRNGQPRYRFAPYEEIMALVQPMVTRHGFAISFDTEIDAGRLTSICTLTHSGGHSKPNKFAVRFTTPPGSSEAQGDMSTKSYAKRGALCDALNIVVDHDDDARMVGAPITLEQAAKLEQMVNVTGSNEGSFLRFAGATSYEEISADRYDSLIELLQRKMPKSDPIRDAVIETGGVPMPEERRDERGFLF